MTPEQGFEEWFDKAFDDYRVVDIPETKYQQHYRECWLAAISWAISNGYRRCAVDQDENSQFCGLVDPAVKAERDRCCKIIYGYCESDVIAQRTVDAIRRGDK